MKLSKAGFSWRRCLHAGHRYLGLVATAFVVILAATGLMLNHTDALKLDTSRVNVQWLMGWYGMELPEARMSFAMGNHRISQIGTQMFLDGKALSEQSDLHLVGAVAAGSMIAMADRTSLVLYTEEGQRVERLTAVHGLPRPIEVLGRDAAGRVAVRSNGQVYVADDAMLSWHAAPATTKVNWAEPHAVSDELLSQYRGNGPTLERVILDLHSGRILGSAGVYLMDGAAIAFLILAGLGVWMWAVRR